MPKQTMEEGQYHSYQEATGDQQTVRASSKSRAFEPRTAVATSSAEREHIQLTSGSQAKAKVHAE